VVASSVSGRVTIHGKGAPGVAVTARSQGNSDMLLTALQPMKAVTDADGNVRVVLVLPTWDDYLAVGLDEIIGASLQSPNVRTRVAQLLRDLLSIAPEVRHPPIRARLTQVLSVETPLVGA